jgi:hypothetical protein
VQEVVAPLRGNAMATAATAREPKPPTSVAHTRFLGGRARPCQRLEGAMLIRTARPAKREPDLTGCGAARPRRPFP